MFINKKIRLVVLAGLMSCPLQAWSLDDGFNKEEANWYLSGGYGVSYVHPQGSSNGWSTDPDGDDSTGLKIALGYKLSEQWSLEAAFGNLGEADLVNVSPPINTLYPEVAIEYKVSSVMLKYDWDISNSDFTVYGKVGAANIRNKATSPIVNFIEQNETLVAFGLGVSYQLNEQWFVRLDADRYSEDANHLTLQIGFSF